MSIKPQMKGKLSHCLVAYPDNIYSIALKGDLRSQEGPPRELVLV